MEVIKYLIKRMNTYRIFDYKGKLEKHKWQMTDAIHIMLKIFNNMEEIT